MLFSRRCSTSCIVLDLTRRAETPVGDLRFVNLVAVVIRRRETRRRAHRTVNVDDSLARSTDQMMVVIVDPILVASGRSHGLNASKKSVLDQHAEGVVHGLTRDGAEVGLGDESYLVGRHVRSKRYCA
jgi:hypothetical protein